jgi:hypothetical protein
MRSKYWCIERGVKYHFQREGGFTWMWGARPGARPLIMLRRAWRGLASRAENSPTSQQAAYSTSAADVWRPDLQQQFGAVSCLYEQRCVDSLQRSLFSSNNGPPSSKKITHVAFILYFYFPPFLLHIFIVPPPGGGGGGTPGFWRDHTLYEF